MQIAAFVLIGGGMATALGFFFKWFFTTPFLPLGFRIAIALVIVGIILLLISIIWGRLRAAKKEDFREDT